MAMIVQEKNKGEKIPYAVKGSKITFDDELMVNVQRFERDDPAHIDICRDRFGNLVTGVIPGYAERYVAQIDIPARAYTETVIDAEFKAQPMDKEGTLILYEEDMDKEEPGGGASGGEVTE